MVYTTIIKFNPLNGSFLECKNRKDNEKCISEIALKFDTAFPENGVSFAFVKDDYLARKLYYCFNC